MTPTDDADQPAPQPSPKDEAAVRRMLADARETGPMPPEVVARLDDALAGLDTERTADGAPVAEVVPLGPRRRRRAAALLVAAAAVVVGGVAVGSYQNSDENSVASGTSADSAVSREDAPNAATVPGAPAQDGVGGSKATRPRPRTDSLNASRADMNALESVIPARVRPAHLTADVKALRRSWPRRVGPSAYSARTPVLPHAFHCPQARFGHGVLLGVRYGDRPAVVAYRTPKGDTQVVEVLQCGTADVLGSTTIPVG